MTWIYEVRAQDGSYVHSFGARETRAEAEALLAESQERVARAGGGNDRYWIEAIPTEGLFRVPPRPAPRDRFTTSVTPTPTVSGHAQSGEVEILDGDRVVATYARNYAMLDTFEPFRQGDRHFALISPDYTATSVIDLENGDRTRPL